MSITKQVLPTDPDYLKAAFELDGLKEIVGTAHEPKVVQLFADAGHSWVTDDETAWCAAFMHSMLGQGGFTGTGSLAARSYLDWGEHISRPQRGDVVIFKRGNSSWQGHVAFFLGVSQGRVTVLGGNQSNAVGVNDYPEMSVLGYRRPSHNLASSDLVRQVQLVLISKGYHEVGIADGDYGPKTRAAILAFEADHMMPLVGRVTTELWESINAADPRPVGEARATGQPENHTAIVAADGQKALGAVTGVGAAIAAAEPIIKQIEDGSGLAQRLSGALTPLVEFMGAFWPVLLIAGAGFLIFTAMASKKQIIADYRTGKSAG